MKKILSFALSILMIVSCFAFTVSAKEITIGEGYDYALAIDDVDAKVGDTVTVVAPNAEYQLKIMEIL